MGSGPVFVGLRLRMSEHPSRTRYPQPSGSRYPQPSGSVAQSPIPSTKGGAGPSGSPSQSRSMDPEALRTILQLSIGGGSEHGVATGRDSEAGGGGRVGGPARSGRSAPGAMQSQSAEQHQALFSEATFGPVSVSLTFL